MEHIKNVKAFRDLLKTEYDAVETYLRDIKDYLDPLEMYPYTPNPKHMTKLMSLSAEFHQFRDQQHGTDECINRTIMHYLVKVMYYKLTNKHLDDDKVTAFVKKHALHLDIFLEEHDILIDHFLHKDMNEFIAECSAKHIYDTFTDDYAEIADELKEVKWTIRE